MFQYIIKILNSFILYYLQGFAPHPSSFTDFGIGIKEPKELHFLNHNITIILYSIYILNI
ncbi:hypothetical protein E6A47_08025 [Brachyspira pilosicoli]|nr:hypothetical protein [Brachyspira pilosicoli]